MASDDVVTTDRLVLRPFAPGDRDALAVLDAIPEFWWYPSRRAHTAEESSNFLDRQIAVREERGFGLWAADLRETGALIGWIGLSVPTFLPEILPAVEVGWRLHPDQWGKGLATEGGVASIDYGFETLGLDRIVSVYEPENAASGKVMERLGLHFDRVTTDPTRGYEVHVLAITRDEWSRLRNPSSR